MVEYVILVASELVAFIIELRKVCESNNVVLYRGSHGWRMRWSGVGE
jgi:hypothetical protein